MTPLQTLIHNRLAELDRSYRAAAAKSGGLISHGQIHQYAMGTALADGMGERAKKGLALALDVPLTQIEKAVGSSMKDKPTKFVLPARADRLNAKQRRAVTALVNALLDEGE